MQKYAEVGSQAENEHTDMVKKIIAVIGIKQLIMQTEQLCHAKAYTVLNEYLEGGEIDNDLAQIIVHCLFSLAPRFDRGQPEVDRKACQGLIGALFRKRDTIQVASLLPLLVHPCLPYENLCALLEELIYVLQNHHLQTLSNIITANRSQNTQDLAQVLKVVIDNVIKVLLARASDAGPAQAVSLIKVIICKEGAPPQLDEQTVLQRQLSFTDALIGHEPAQEPLNEANEVGEGGAAPRPSARSLLLQALRQIIEDQHWPRCKPLLRSILMLTSKYHQECF